MTAAERDPAYGRLDRTLAAAKVAHEPGGDPDLNDSPLNGCWVGDGCRGQHTLAQHLAVEEVLNAGPTDDWEAQLIEAAGGAMLDRLRGMVAALTDALDTRTHPFEPGVAGEPQYGDPRWCAAEDGECGLAADHPVHRTPAVVRAGLGTGAP